LAIIGLFVLGWYLNKIYGSFLFEFLLTLTAILQFEIAYRQLWPVMRRDKPVISVYSLEEKDVVYLMVKNLGPTPAFLVQASALFKHGEPLSPGKWEGIKHQTIEFLEPSSERTLAAIDRDFYEEVCREGYAIGVSYFDRDGESNHFMVYFSFGVNLGSCHVRKSHRGS